MRYEDVMRVLLLALVTLTAYFAGRNDEHDERSPWWVLAFVAYTVGFGALP